MSRHFTATVLMQRPWPLDIDAVARAVREQFPRIGDIAAASGQPEARDQGVLEIEGAGIVLVSRAERVASGDLHPPMKTLKSWDPLPALRTHRARLSVTCGGDLPGLEGAEACAAATHFVAAAAASVVPVAAVLWNAGWALMAPEAFSDAADTLMAGRMPLGAWIGFAPVVPMGFGPAEATGMLTYGLRPFIGRELELAPRPGGARSAWGCLSAVTRLVLDRGLALHDGLRLDADGDSPALTVRERSFWLRRDASAFVLVADDAVVDRETLEPRQVPVA